MIKEKESWQKMNKQIAVITGASSGFGLLTTLELAKKRLFSYRYNEKP